MQTLQAPPAEAAPAFLERRRTADLVFKGALTFNTSLTVFWLVMLATGGNAFFFGSYDVSLGAVGRVLGGVFFFYVLWGFIWYGIKFVQFGWSQNSELAELPMTFIFAAWPLAGFTWVLFLGEKFLADLRTLATPPKRGRS